MLEPGNRGNPAGAWPVALTAALAAVLGLLGARPLAACHAVANAGGPYAAGCQGPTTSIALDGTASPSCPGERIEYLWSSDCPGAVFDDPTSLTPILTMTSPPPCPLSCTVTLTAIDPDLGSKDEDDASVTVEDSEPPFGAGEDATLASLWPPDHRYVCFGAEALLAALGDACSGVASWQVTGCRSSEPDDAPGMGDGHTREDCRIVDSGHGVCARAERAGSGAGRRYELSGEATDACGNWAAVVMGDIVVGHDRREARGPGKR